MYASAPITKARQRLEKRLSRVPAGLAVNSFIILE
jgi:hypothetical protein